MKKTSITSGQLNSVADLVKAELRRKATKEGAQIFLGKGDEFKKIIAEAYDRLSSLHIAHPDLEFVNEFPVDIPTGFTVNSSDQQTYNYWNVNLIMANFPKSGIIAGRRYVCEIYRLMKEMSSENLATAGEKNGRLLGGALGTARISSPEYRQNLPEGRVVIGIDHEKNLWRDPDGGLHVPGCSRHGAHVSAGLHYWDVGWRGGRYVAYFRDLGPCA